MLLLGNIQLKMKRLKSIFKKYHTHLVPILVIGLCTLFVWYKILNQTLLGEGYHYFDHGHRRFDTINTFFASDTFPKLLFEFLPNIFMDNILLYIILQLLVMISLYTTLYLTIYKITKSKLIGISSSIFFLASYIGSFTMMGTGAYDRFMERVPNLIILLLSFYLLDKFFKTRVNKVLLISYLLFFLGNFLAHHSIFLVPIFLLLPFGYYIANISNKKKSKLSLIKAGLISSLFFVTTLIINSFETLKPTRGFLEFISTDSTLLKKIFYQIPILFIPKDLISFIGKISGDSTPFAQTSGMLLLPILIVLILGIFLVKKRLAHSLPLYLATLLSLPVTSFLNIYAYDSSPNPLKNFGEDRIYFISSICSSIVLALLLKSFFKKATDAYKIASVIILICYISYNSQLIWKNIDLAQYKSEAMKRYLVKVDHLSPQFKEKVIIVAPPEFQWPIALIRLKYNNQNIEFMAFHTGWEKEINLNDKSAVFVLDYDYELLPGQNYDPNKGKFIDKTEEFRSGKEVIPIN